jgi:hypothetical protein
MKLKRNNFKNKSNILRRKKKGTKEILEKYQILKNINIMKLV